MARFTKQLQRTLFTLPTLVSCITCDKLALQYGRGRDLHGQTDINEGR